MKPDLSDPSEVERLRNAWRAAPRVRPASIAPPGPGRESVWDYPRPPRVEPVSRHVRVEFGGITLADTTHALRVCETSSPPCYYVPSADLAMRHVEPADRTSLCEWKGIARYWSIRVGERFAKDAAWSYPDPWVGYEAIRDYLAFYPRRMDACWLGGQSVEPQPGLYYGGWVTPELVGPFKGAAGTEMW